MSTNTIPLISEATGVIHHRQAANSLAIVRLTVGAMSVSVFLRIWGKAFTPRRAASILRKLNRQITLASLQRVLDGGQRVLEIGN